MAFASTHWRWLRGYPQCMVPGTISTPAAWSPIDLALPICFGVPPSLSTKSCADRSRTIFRSSSQRSSSWSSISRLPGRSPGDFVDAARPRRRGDRIGMLCAISISTGHPPPRRRRRSTAKQFTAILVCDTSRMAFEPHLCIHRSIQHRFRHGAIQFLPSDDPDTFLPINLSM